MRTFSIFAVVLVTVGWILGSRYCYTCIQHNACGDSPTEVNANGSEERAKGLTFAVDNKPVFTGFDQFAFSGDGNKNLDLNPNNEAFLDSVAAYLKQNPNAKVEIAGRFFKGETGAGFLDNAGLVRADLVRQALAKRGIDVDNRVDISSQQLAAGTPFGEPLSFSGTAGNVDIASADPSDVTTPAGEEGEEKLETAKFTFSNMTFSDVSFESGSAVFVPVTQFVNYADSVALFLKDSPEKKIKIIGHTDSDGAPDMNMALGRNRARSVRDFMVNKYKLNKEDILIDSKGETSPVATNKTEDGKRRNRRVNIQILD